MHENKKKDQSKIQKIAAVVFWLAVWQAAAMLIHQEIFLASPLQVFKTLAGDVRQREFWLSISFSMERIVGGFSLALLAGILLAVLAARFRFVRILLNPVMITVRSIPVASFVILALLWFGSRNLSIIISFLMVMPVIYNNTLQGILQTDPKLLEMAHIFRIGNVNQMIYIYIPQVMPYLTAGCTIGLGLCWKSGIAAEVIGIPGGSIGEKLYEAKIYLSSGDLFAWTLVIVLISAAFEKFVLFLLSQLEKHIENQGS